MLSSTFSSRLRSAMTALIGLAAALTMTVASDAQATIPSVATYVWTNNAWVATSNTTISTHPLYVKGAVSTPTGVGKFTMSFSGNQTGSCTTNSGWVYTGAFYLTLPGLQEVYPRPGTNQVTRYAKIAAPTCSVPGQSGVPYGHSFTMTVQGMDTGPLFPSIVTKEMVIKVG
jgi:hypothetical protein